MRRLSKVIWKSRRLSRLICYVGGGAEPCAIHGDVLARFGGIEERVEGTAVADGIDITVAVTPCMDVGTGYGFQIQFVSPEPQAETAGPRPVPKIVKKEPCAIEEPGKGGRVKLAALVVPPMVGWANPVAVDRAKTTVIKNRVFTCFPPLDGNPRKQI
jgi:hypothetical protein